MYKRYFIRISYDGTNYHGWQKQENAHTVQEELEQVLSTALQTKIEVTGCGRTDAGVHAKIFYAHFDTNKIIGNPDEFKNLKFKINCMLPHDIAVQQLFNVGEKDHARFNVAARTYTYIISRFKDPFLINKSYFFSGALDIDLMNKASGLLIKYKDFSCFSKTHTQVKTNDCNIYSAEWKLQDGNLVFTIKANRFLRGMVRAIVGTMLELGKGWLDIKNFIGIIESKNRTEAGASVPASGLYLTEVDYL